METTKSSILNIPMEKNTDSYKVLKLNTINVK